MLIKNANITITLGIKLWHNPTLLIQFWLINLIELSCRLLECYDYPSLEMHHVDVDRQMCCTAVTVETDVGVYVVCVSRKRVCTSYIYKFCKTIFASQSFSL